MAFKPYALLRWSLVFVWLFTAFASLWELHGQSASVLAHAGIADGANARLLTMAGAAVDGLIGLAMLVRPGRFVYLAALLVMLLMTLVATVLDPGLWLHPLGPLSKNLPIAAALWLLSQET